MIRRRLAVALLAGLALSCGGGDSPTSPDSSPGATSCTTAGQCTFVRDTLQSWYSWYKELPNPDPTSFGSPEAYLEAVRYRDLDSSFSYITSKAASDAFYSDIQFIGFGFSYKRTGDVELRIAQAFPGSPAAEAGMDRGDTFVTIGGKPVADLYKGKPIIGVLREFNRDSLAFLEQSWLTYGDHFVTRLGPRTLHIISDPLFAQEALTTRKHILRRSQNFEGGTPLTYILGLSMITIDRDSWLLKRRMMQPVFHRSNITAMGDKMQSAGEPMLERWSQLTADKIVELTKEMKLVTLDIINRTMFSYDVLREVDRLGGVVDSAPDFIAGRAGNPFSLPARWTFIPSHKKFWQERAKLDDYLFRMVRERRAALAKGERKNDLLEMLIEAQDADTGEKMFAKNCSSSAFLRSPRNSSDTDPP